MTTIYQPSKTQEHMGGPAYLFRFEGSPYGASVIQHWGSYGGNDGYWELAVMKQNEDDGYELCYDTPITNDVIGWLTWEEVQALLARIDALPPGRREEGD